MRNFDQHYQIPTMYRKGGNSMLTTIKGWAGEFRKDIIFGIQEIYRKGMTRDEFLQILSCGIFIFSIAIGLEVLKALSK